MINTGDTITFSITTVSTFSKGYAGILSDVSALLASQGFVVQLNAAAGSDFLTDVAGTLALSGAPYTVSIDVTSGDDYGSANDVGSIIANAFYQVSGYYPQISATDINGRPTGDSEAGGVLGTQPGKSLSDIISDFFSKISSTTTTILVVVAGIIILVLVLAAYGPNSGRIAALAAV